MKSSERGQALVEFALIISLFVVIILVLLDVGRGVYYAAAMHNAAREAARQGVIIGNCDSAKIEEVVHHYAIGLQLDSMTVNSVCSGTTDTIQVEILYSFIPATPIVGILSGSNIVQMRTESKMKLEGNLP